MEKYQKEDALIGVEKLIIAINKTKHSSEIYTSKKNIIHGFN